MADNDKTSDIINAAANLAKAIPVYDDALQPVMKETGKALGTAGRAVNAALAPIRGLVWGAEQIEDWVANRVARKLVDIPEDDIQTPDLAIAGPTIEALRFNGHKPELSEMFANLLANSMNSSNSEITHPSFVTIISTLSSLDAQLFAAISIKSAIPTIHINSKTPDNSGLSPVVMFYRPDLHAIAQKFLVSGEHGLAAMQAGIEQLDRLGLIEAINDGHLTSAENLASYKELEEGDLMSAFKRKAVDGPVSFVSSKSYIRLTQMGRNFKQVVLD